MRKMNICLTVGAADNNVARFLCSEKWVLDIGEILGKDKVSIFTRLEGVMVINVVRRTVPY